MVFLAEDPRLLEEELVLLADVLLLAEPLLVDAGLDDPRVVEEDEERAELLRRELERVLALWALGTSCFTTSFVSWSIVFSRKLAIRSSCLRNSLASFAVSRSPTAVASASIAR